MKLTPNLVVLALWSVTLLICRAQSVSTVYLVPDNGALVTMVYATDAKGDVLSYTSEKEWMYSGHTPFQARVVTAAIPANQSSKMPVAAVPSVSTLYTYYAAGRAAFNARVVGPVEIQNSEVNRG